MSVQEKRCGNCFQTKPVTEFYKKLDGYKWNCKACNPEVVRGFYERKREKLRDNLNEKLNKMVGKSQPTKEYL